MRLSSRPRERERESHNDWERRVQQAIVSLCRNVRFVRERNLEGEYILSIERENGNDTDTKAKEKQFESEHERL